MDAATERELLNRAQRGDGAAFMELITPHLPGLFRLGYGVLRDVGLTDQAVQEAQRKAWEARRRCRGSFKAWLFTIARNVARDMHQEAYRRHSVPLGEETGEAFHRPGEPFEEDVVRRRLIDDALAGLSFEAREIIILNHFAGLDLREAAEVLGISHNAARQRHHRAVAALRSSWNRQMRRLPARSAQRTRACVPELKLETTNGKPGCWATTPTPFCAESGLTRAALTPRMRR